MTPKLIISPPATGKTEACINRILKLLSLKPFARVWVIVPNQQMAAYFKARLAAAGGGMGIQVRTFRDFYQEILEEHGVFVPVITSALSYRLIRTIVREAHAAGELTHYDAIKEKPGFLSVLRDAFAELRSAMVTPSALLNYTSGATIDKHELAILYNRFIARLETLGWVDAEGQAWLAIETIKSKPNLTSPMKLVIIDGFTSFTPSQRQFLKYISQQAEELFITLTGEIGSTREVNMRSQLVFDKLQSDFTLEILDFEPLKLLPEEILHMQRQILELDTVEKLDTQKPFMLELSSQSEEAKEALRWIKKLHVREHVPLGACAIYTANLDMYQSILRSAAEEFGLKVYFSQPDSLSESPPVLALLSLLSLSIEGYPTRNLLNTLRSPYFDFGLDQKDLNDLEICSQQAIIVGGKEQWDEAWSMLRRSQINSEEHPDEERQRKIVLTGIDLSTLQMRLERFWQLFTCLETDRSLVKWVEWLEDMLNDLGFYVQISNERDREACSALGDALRALTLSENVIGTEAITYTQFVGDLQESLVNARVEESRASRKEAVFIGKMVEARGARYEAVVLMGMSEGLFPVIENPDPFLDEQMRRDWGLETRLERHQPSIFYQAFTRANKYLLLTRPYLTEEGERWEPSPYWETTVKLFNRGVVSRVKASQPRSQSEAASAQELLFWAVQQQRLQYTQDSELIDRWESLRKARYVLEQRRAKTANGVFEGDLTQFTDGFASKFSAGYVWSASRLGMYKSCPFRFLIGAMLKLEPKEPPELGLDAAQKGSIYHRILELVYRNEVELGSSPLENLDEAAAKVFSEAPMVDGFRPSALWEVEKAELFETLRNTLEALEIERSQWKPFKFEQKFGLDSNPPLMLEIDGSIILIRGLIDRLDIDSNGELRVIDYKSGSTSSSKKDLLDGSSLQLPIYAMAAQSALELGEVQDGFYWNIKDAKSSSIKLSNFQYEGIKGPDAAYQVAREHIQDILTGARAGNFAPTTPESGCPEYCPSKSWCWRYEAGFKND